MECKCATIQDAWKWARQLPFKTDALIQIVFATGPLAKGCVSIPRKEFLDGFAAYAIFHFDRDAKCAKLLGALTNAVLPTRGNVFIRLSELSLLLVRQVSHALCQQLIYFFVDWFPSTTDSVTITTTIRTTTQG